MTLILSGTNGLSDVDGTAATPAIRGTDTNTGIFFPAADTIAFSEGGVESMRIDSSGNVGLGVTPSAWVSGYKAIQLTEGVAFSEGGGNTYLSNNWFNDGTNKYIANGTAALYGQSGGTHAWYNAASGTAGNTISFTQAMTLDASGNLGINTSSPSSYGALAVRKGVAGTWLGVTSNSSFHASDAVNNSFYITHNTANSGSTFLCSDAGGRLQMFCSSSATGGVYLGNGATSWTSASDERVKENLVPIENGLAKVASLRTVTGNYINDESKKSRAFLIAQDVEAVLPEAVDHSNPDELGLSYTDVIPLLVASIQEMKAIIDTQASTITQLQADVAALKGTA